MTVQNIFDEARYLAQVNSNDATDAQLYLLLNNEVEDQVNFVSGIREDFLLKQGTSQNLVNATTDYTLATDILHLKVVQLALDGTNYYVAVRKDFVEDNNLNQTTSGESMSEPKYIVITNTASTEFIIRIQPQPTAAVTNGLRYWYIHRPAALAATSSIPVTPPELHQGLVYGVAERLKLREGEGNISLLLGRKKEEVLQRYKVNVGQRNIDRQQSFYAPTFLE